MKDLQFFQNNPRGPVTWGDLELTPDGDLSLLSGNKSVDVQDAVIRLLTNRSHLVGFGSAPSVGADLGKFLGEPLTVDTLRGIDRACERALRSDKRFPPTTQVRTIPIESDTARIYVLLPKGDGYEMLDMPLSFSSQRGVEVTEESESSPWLWRRGQAAIQQTTGFWRAWLGAHTLWRMTPDQLVVRGMRQTSLEEIGLFTEPFLLFEDGLVFCGRGPAEGMYYPKAWTKVDGWYINTSARTGVSLPYYNLPDGVWCDEETGWNIVIIIDGQTAGQFNEAENRWEFQRITEIDFI